MSKRKADGTLQESKNDNTIEKRLKLIDSTIEEISKDIEAYSYNGYNRNMVLAVITAEPRITALWIKLALIFFNNGTNEKKVKDIQIPGENITVGQFTGKFSFFKYRGAKTLNELAPSRLMNALAPQLFYLNSFRLGNYTPSNNSPEDLRINHLSFASLPFKTEYRQKFDSFRMSILSRITNNNSSFDQNHMGNSLRSNNVYAMQVSRCLDWTGWDWMYLKRSKCDLFQERPANTADSPRIPLTELNLGFSFVDANTNESRHMETTLSEEENNAFLTAVGPLVTSGAQILKFEGDYYFHFQAHLMNINNFLGSYLQLIHQNEIVEVNALPGNIYRYDEFMTAVNALMQT